MTVREKILKLIVEYGLMPPEAAKIVDSLALQDGCKDVKWNDDTAGYPVQLLSVLWVSAASMALDYIDETCPRHWARPLFAEVVPSHNHHVDAGTNCPEMEAMDAAENQDAAERRGFLKCPGRRCNATLAECDACHLQVTRLTAGGFLEDRTMTKSSLPVLRTYSDMSTAELEEWRQELASNKDWVAVCEITDVLTIRDADGETLANTTY